MNIAVILAGGVGARVGAGIPKQFIEVCGKPILAYTIEHFEKHQDVDKILVVCIEQYIENIWDIKKRYGFEKLEWVTEGGASFQESVLNGVNYLKDKIEGNDVVLFHFGASPFVTSDIIADVIKVCKENGTNAISTTDYYLLSGIKKINSSVADNGNYSEEYIDRETIAVMNTPHAFMFDFIVNLYEEALQTGVINSVEPHTTTLMYALKKKIYFAKGSQSNIKITTKEDLQLFEGYVLEKQRNLRKSLSGDVVIFVADGFEESEAIITADILMRAGLNVIMTSVTKKREVRSSRNVIVWTDCLVEDVQYESVKMLVLPGGRKGVECLREHELVKRMCQECADDRYIAALCAAPSILAEWGLIREKEVTVHPDYASAIIGSRILDESVVIDGNIITGRGLGSTIPFSLTLVEILKGENVVEQIRKEICYL